MNERLLRLHRSNGKRLSAAIASGRTQLPLAATVHGNGQSERRA